MRWQNAENNDDITALDLHPTRDNLLLAGGDDGLVSLFDLGIVEEDDSLVQAVNHGPIHKAGFFDTDRLFALSSDQDLALHPIFSAEREAEPSPVLFGDLRPLIPCEYVIDIVGTGTDFAVATGSHRSVP
jgi:WD repeat-containing protein 89